MREEEERKKKNAPTESGPLPDYTQGSWKIFACEETPHSDIIKEAMKHGRREERKNAPTESGPFPDYTHKS